MRLDSTSEIHGLRGAHIGECPFESSDGLVRLVVDRESFSFYISCHLGYRQRDYIRAAECALRHFGLDLIDFEECEPDVTAYGTTHCWLTPVEPVYDLAPGAKACA